MPQTRTLLIDGNRGIYIPQNFYNNFDFHSWCLKREDFKELASLDNEHYWDAWDDLLNQAKHIDDEGKTWYLEQDDDLFAVNGSDDDDIL